MFWIKTCHRNKKIAKIISKILSAIGISGIFLLFYINTIDIKQNFTLLLGLNLVAIVSALIATLLSFILVFSRVNRDISVILLLIGMFALSISNIVDIIHQMEYFTLFGCISNVSISLSIILILKKKLLFHIGKNHKNRI